MLSASVDAGKRLLVEEDLEVMFGGDIPHHGHQKQVMVHCDIDFLKLWSTFELVRSHFIMPGLDRNAQSVGRIFKILHKGLHPLRNCSPIVVFELLVLGCRVAHKSPSGLNEVRAGVVKCLVHKEIFLLPTEGRENFGDILVEKLADIHSSLVKCSH